MAKATMAGALASVVFLGLLCLGCAQIPLKPPPPTSYIDAHFFQFALNLEYLEAEFYLKAYAGKGVEGFEPNLTGGGPPSLGGRKGELSDNIQDIAKMLGFQELGHIRIFREYLANYSLVIPRPLIDVSVEAWTKFARIGIPDLPIFDPYSNDDDFLLASYVLPYVGLTGYVGTNPALTTIIGKALLAAVLGVEGGQDALLRDTLWFRRKQRAPPAELRIQKYTGAFSKARNYLDRSGMLDDENIEVSKALGAENGTMTNILSANFDSLSYGRTVAEVIRIIYGTGKANVPGGFYPNGANGYFADFYRSHPEYA